MVPGLSRWIWAAALGCAAIIAVFLPPAEWQPDPAFDRFSWEATHWTPERRLEKRFQVALNQVRRALETATDSELFVRQLGNQPAGAHGPTLFFAGTLPAEERRAAQEVFDSVSRVLQLTSPDIDLVMQLDLDPHKQPRATRRLRVAGGRAACDVDLRLGWQDKRIVRSPGGQEVEQVERGLWLVRLKRYVTDDIGACAYYAAFGRPGIQVRKWLLSRHSFWRERGDRLQSVFVEGIKWDSESKPLDWEKDIASLPLHSRGCVQGQLYQCRAFVFDSLAPFRWSDQWYLSDLVHSMGRERFGRFWRSPAPVDSAFHQAFGVPIEDWTRDWMVRRRGGDTGSPSHPGLLPIFVGLLLAVAALGGASLYAERRQVG